MPTQFDGYSASMAFDAATGQVVLAGGTTGTWTWDGRTWTQQHPHTSPTDRYRPLLGYDGGTKHVVMFGADDASLVPGQVSLTDTWTWNGVTWAEQHPAHHPTSGRGCAAYDEATGQFLMLGIDASFVGATWTWTGGDWTQLPSALPQIFFTGCSMVYDPDLHALVALMSPGFGGEQLWSWNGQAWTVLQDRMPWLTGWSTANTITFDPSAGQPVALVMAARAGLPSELQVWLLTGTSWSRLSSSTMPPAQGQFIGDSATHQVVLLSEPYPLSQTWVYSSAGGSSVTPTRLFGADRAATAAAMSQSTFADAGSGSAVVLARSDVFSDALAGGTLAGAKHAPLLLTSGGSLDAVTKAEIQRVLPVGGTVYLLGGTAALSDSVSAAIAALGDIPSRIAGADRYATAVAIAQVMGDPATVFEVSGTNFPDALSAVPAAIAAHGVVLLTNGITPAPSTSAYLVAHPGTHYAIGGPAATADPSAIAIVGADRFATSGAVALAFFPDATAVALASGMGFADALAGGSAAGSVGEPLLLAPAAGSLPEPITAYLSTHAGAITKATVLGGAKALGDDIVTAVATTIANAP